jgi:hypothetical protein
MRWPTLFVIALASYLVNFSHASTGQDPADLINKGQVTAGGIGTFDGLSFVSPILTDVSTEQTGQTDGFAQDESPRRRKKRYLKYNKRLGSGSDSGPVFKDIEEFHKVSPFAVIPFVVSLEVGVEDTLADGQLTKRETGYPDTRSTMRDDVLVFYPDAAKAADRVAVAAK